MSNLQYSVAEGNMQRQVTAIAVNIDVPSGRSVQPWWHRIGGSEHPQEIPAIVSRIAQLAECWDKLRRPAAAHLRDGIGELRANYKRVHNRVLFFFHGQDTVVVSHGLTKEGKVDDNEIDKAIERKEAYERDPAAHSFEG